MSVLMIYKLDDWCSGNDTNLRFTVAIRQMQSRITASPQPICELERNRALAI